MQKQNGFLSVEEHDIQDLDKKKIYDLQNETTQKILRNGWVLYLLNKKEIFIDQGKQIIMQPNVDDDDAILSALILAKEKFYGRLEITGTAEFQQKAMLVMLKNDISIEFTNPHQELMFKELSKSYANGFKSSQNDKEPAERTESKLELEPTEKKEQSHINDQDNSKKILSELNHLLSLTNKESGSDIVSKNVKETTYPLSKSNKNKIRP